MVFCLFTLFVRLTLSLFKGHSFQAQNLIVWKFGSSARRIFFESWGSIALRLSLIPVHSPLSRSSPRRVCTGKERGLISRRAAGNDRAYFWQDCLFLSISQPECIFQSVCIVWSNLVLFQIDLVEIKAAFLQKYHKTLYKMIQGDCSGDYKKLLLTAVGMNWDGFARKNYPSFL